jgi:hypothetical protein
MLRLPSEEAIETDGDHDPADDRHGIQVLRLPVRIKRRQEEQTGQAPGDAGRDDFRDDVNAALRTAMSFV